MRKLINHQKKITDLNGIHSKATKEIQKRNEKIEALEKKLTDFEKLTQDYEELKMKYFIALGVGIKLNHTPLYSRTDLKKLFPDAPDKIEQWASWLEESKSFKKKHCWSFLKSS